MHYAEVAPDPALRPYVRCYWTLNGERSTLAPEPILPDGGWEIVFQLGDPFDQWEGECRRRQPRVLLVADVTHPITVGPSGSIETFGIRFRPGGAYPFFRLPLGQLSGAVGPLENAWPDAEIIRQRIGNEPTLAGRVAILDEVLRRQLDRCAGDPSFDRLIRHLRHHHDVRVRTVADLCGVSERQIERRFRERIGLSPRTFLSVLRFDALVRRIRASSGSWSRAALDFGYYDQSHMIHEFRRFSGMTPGEFAGSLLPLNDSFHHSGQAASDFSNR